VARAPAVRKSRLVATLDRSTQLSGRQPEYRIIDDAELMLTIYAATAG